VPRAEPPCQRRCVVGDDRVDCLVAKPELRGQQEFGGVDVDADEHPFQRDVGLPVDNAGIAERVA